MTQLEKLLQGGIRRHGSPRSGFRYTGAAGKPVSSLDRERIEALRIPPAWTEVAINPSSGGRLQAIGKDNAGRWQYRYHPDFVRRREEQKYQRLVRFAEALPRMRAAIRRDLRKPGLCRERVMACLLEILATCFIRPGSQAYAAENGHYGLATLRPRHVHVTGGKVTFHFIGKSGQLRHRELHDVVVARIIRQLLATPGRQVFKFFDEEGELHEVRRRHINQYIKEVMGSDFTAKDFRTWAGTLICACALARVGTSGDESPTARKRKVVAAIRETAAILGNTPAVCRSAYVYPSILSGFEQGRVIDSYFDTVEELVVHRHASLHHAEEALLAMLRKEAVQKPRGGRGQVIPLARLHGRVRAQATARAAALQRAALK